MSFRRALVLVAAAFLVPACGGSRDSGAPAPPPRLHDLELVSLTIGYEVDLFLSGAAAYGRYAAFYSGAAAYARSKRPGLRVGVVATFAGLTGPAKPLLQSLNASSDVVSVTYYP